jgi:hypothetical protein
LWDGQRACIQRWLADCDACFLAIINVDGDILSCYLDKSFEHFDLRGAVILYLNCELCPSYRSDGGSCLDLEARQLIGDWLNSMVSFSDPLVEDDDLCKAISPVLHPGDAELCLIL